MLLLPSASPCLRMNCRSRVYTYRQCSAELIAAAAQSPQSAGRRAAVYSHHRKLHVAFAFGIFTLATSASQALAVTTFWNTVNNGNFSNPANWNNGVPGSSDTAVFREGIGA